MFQICQERKAKEYILPTLSFISMPGHRRAEQMPQSRAPRGQPQMHLTTATSEDFSANCIQFEPGTYQVLECFTAPPKLFFSPVSDLRNHDIRGKPGEWEEDIRIWLKSQAGNLATTTMSGDSGNQHLHISSTVDGQPGSRHTKRVSTRYSHLQ